MPFFFSLTLKLKPTFHGHGMTKFELNLTKCTFLGELFKDKIKRQFTEGTAEYPELTLWCGQRLGNQDAD